MGESFNRLVDKVGALAARGDTLASRLGARLGKVFQETFLNEPDAPMEETSEDPYSPERDSGFLQGVGLEEVLGSFYDFGKSVLDEFGAVVTQVFDGISEAVQEEKKNGDDAGLGNSCATERSLSILTVFLFAVARERFSQFLQNRKLCRDLRKQSSECWQLQSQCEVCHGALLTGEVPSLPPPAQTACLSITLKRSSRVS